MNKLVLFFLVTVFSLTGNDKTKEVPSLTTLAILSLEKDTDRANGVNRILEAIKPERMPPELVEHVILTWLLNGERLKQHEMIPLRGTLIALLCEREQNARAGLLRNFLENSWSEEQKKRIAEGLLASQKIMQDVYEIVLKNSDYTVDEKQSLILAFYQSFNIQQEDKTNLYFLLRFFKSLQSSEVVTITNNLILPSAVLGCFEPVAPITLLLKFGAHAAIVDTHGETLLHEAVRGGRALAVQTLLKHVPELANKRANYGVFPLHLAVGIMYNKEGQKQIIKALLAAGADKNARYNGKTPIEAYRERLFGDEPDSEITRLLATE